MEIEMSAKYESIKTMLWHEKNADGMHREKTDAKRYIL